jgi:hypothetical protein
LLNNCTDFFSLLKDRIVSIVSSAFHHDSVEVPRDKSCESILITEEAEDDHHKKVVMLVDVLAASAQVEATTIAHQSIQIDNTRNAQIQRELLARDYWPSLPMQFTYLQRKIKLFLQQLHLNIKHLKMLLNK